MTKPQFSPGPWIAGSVHGLSSTRTLSIITISGDGDSMAYVGDVIVHSADNPETLANMTLMASAPELFEALQALRNACKDDPSKSTLVEKANAALGKATRKTSKRAA